MPCGARARKVSKNLKRTVYERSEGKCWYCGRQTFQSCSNRFIKSLFTVDHKLPWSRGGFTTLDNLVAACAQCNRDKGDMDVEEFREVSAHGKNAVTVANRRYLESLGVDMAAYMEKCAGHEFFGELDAHSRV